MHRFQTLPLWLRQSVIGLGLFLAGGLFMFGYSYRPLHGARVWQIQQLESRLDAVNRENLSLGDELAKLRSATSSRVDPETLAQVERELEKTKAALAKTEQDLKSSQGRRREVAANATRWQRRYEALRDAPAADPTPAAAAGTRPGIPDAPSDVSSAPVSLGSQPESSPASPEVSGNAMLEGDERPLP